MSDRKAQLEMTLRVSHADAALIWHQATRGGRQHAQLNIHTLVHHMVRDKAHAIRRLMRRDLLPEDEVQITANFLRRGGHRERT